ncbi:MAG: beta strand repeat-containing protein, partial [Dolichospermum sp.]
LNAVSQDPPNATFTVTIKPSEAVTKVISGAVANGMIRLNGADRITFDGRFGGSGNYLIFRNTSTSNPTITLLNDATLNTIQYTTIEGATTTSTNGVVFLSTGATTGNDNNTISNNLIRDRSDVAGVPANLIYSLGSSPSIANSDNNITNNELFNFTAAGVLVSSTGNGNTWNISNNSFYQTAARTTALRAIQVQAGGGHTINNNSIGGANPSRGGSAMTTSGNIFLIDVASVASTPTTNIQGNNFGNINSTAAITSQYCIGVTGTGNVNIGTTAANNIGGAIAGDITVANSLDGIFWNSTGTGDIRNNIIKNLTYNAADFERLCGVTAQAGTVTIKGNTVRDLLHKGNTTSIVGSPFSLLGIFLSGGNSSLVEGNSIYNLVLDFNALANQSQTYQFAGIHVEGAIGATVNANRIYNLTTTRTGTGTAAPNISGIITGTTGSATYSNNQIVLNQSTASTQPLYKGIWMRSTAGNNNIWYNTVVVAGTAAATNNTYALLRDITSGSLSIRNNILHNERSGASSNNYSIGTVSSTGFTSTVTCNTNLYIASDLTKMGEFATGVNQTIAQWRTSGLGDANSFSYATAVVPNSIFTSTSTGDLSLVAGVNRALVARRAGVVTTTIDYTSNSRDATNPSIGSIEYAGVVGNWTGATSTAYNTVTNWSTGVEPNGGENVSVPTWATNMPLLDATKTVGDLTLATGTSLGLNNQALTINGTISGAGSLVGSATSSLSIGGTGALGTLN